jgi:hypothetical protein
MKLRALLTSALLCLISGAAFSQTPIETYIYNSPGGQATQPLASTVRIPVVPSVPATPSQITMQWVPGNIFLDLTSPQSFSNKTVDCNVNNCLNFPGGGGGVSSVGLTTPAWLTVTGSPITGAGVLAITGTSESANLFLASPNGTSGAMTPRSIVGADLPNPSASTLGGTESIAAVTHQFLTGLSTSGVFSQAQPAFADLSGAPASGALLLSAGAGANPTGLAPVNGDCVTGQSGVWAAIACPSGTTGANPTATIGASATNGSLTTFMRSDAAPAIGSNAVTNALLAQGAANTLKGNNTGSPANEADLTVAQVKTLLAYAFTDLSGSPSAAQVETNLGAAISLLCSASTTTFARGDGTCATPAGSGTVTSIVLQPGLTTTIGTQNTAGQSITTTGNVNLQLYPSPQTTAYNVLTSDTGALLLANGGSAITFTLPNPATGTKGTQYQFADETGHGFTLSTVGVTALFTGCTGGGGTTLAGAANTGISVVDSGTFYSCLLYGGGGAVSSVSGTAGQVTVTPTTGAAVVSLPATLTQAQTASAAWNFTGTLQYKQAAPAPCPLTDAPTIAVAASCGGVQTVTIAGNRTVGFPTGQIASTNQIMTFEVTQDATGGRTLALASGYSPSTMPLFPGAGQVTTFSCAVDAASSTAQCTGGAPNGATATNCANGASPALCGSARAGQVAVPTGVTPTLVVNNTSVTSASEILLTVDESATIPSTTCNSTLAQLVQPIILARTPGTSFTIQVNATITGTPLCVVYHMIN